ncbi:MAG TPA: hypothetical protein VL463_25880 [Kofleriaceae bacterium]|nr:hypothetical protein [Kofleriaceae bacterium]
MIARRAALAAIALSLGAIACGKSSRGGSDARAVTGLGAVPSGVVAIVGIDVSRLAGSPLVVRAVDDLLARRPELTQRIDALEASCHLDLTNKVKRVILASGPREKDGTTPVLLVASGQIAESDLTSCLEKSVGAGGGKVTAIAADGRTIYKIEEGRRQVYYAFGASDTVVLSNVQPWVEKALGAGPKVMDDAEMKAWIGMSDQAAPMWLAAKVDPKVGEGLVRVGNGQIHAGPKAVFASMDPSAGVRAELGAVMQSEDDAKALESFSKSQVGLLALAAQWKGLGPVVEKVVVARDSAVLRLRVSLDDKDVRDLFSAIDTTAVAPQDAHP